MLPVHRERTDEVAFIPADGWQRERLDRRQQLDFGSVPSQRRLQVSPDGRWLAYATADGAIHLHDGRRTRHTIAAVHDRDIRFSSDGNYLAALTGGSLRSE